MFTLANFWGPNLKELRTEEQKDHKMKSPVVTDNVELSFLII